MILIIILYSVNCHLSILNFVLPIVNVVKQLNKTAENNQGILHLSQNLLGS